MSGKKPGLLFPFIWGSGQVLMSWYQLITDLLSLYSLSIGLGANSNQEVVSCNNVEDQLIGEKKPWIAISVVLIVASYLAQAVVAKVIRQKWRHVLFALLQLDEALSVQKDTDEKVKRYLAAGNISQAFFSGMQALLVLYVMLSWMAKSTKLTDCIPEGTGGFFKMYSFQLAKVLGGIYAISHGLQFLAQYTGHTTFHLDGYTVPDSVIQKVVGWLKYDLPLTFFLYCSIAAHIFGYALVGAMTNGGIVFALVFGKMAAEFLLLVFVVYGDADYTTWPARLWGSTWKASVSSIASIPWRNPRNSGNVMTFSTVWAFSVSFAVSFCLLLAEAVVILKHKFYSKKSEVHYWYTLTLTGVKTTIYVHDSVFPGDDGVGWILLGFVLAQPLCFWVAYKLATSRQQAFKPGAQSAATSTRV